MPLPLTVKIRSNLGLRDSPGDRGACPVCADPRSFAVKDSSDGGRTLVHCFAGCTQDAIVAELTKRGMWEAGEAPAEPVPTLRSYSVSDLFREPPVSWLVKGVFPTRGIGGVVGDSGSGKTFVVLDLIGALLRGRSNWMGRKLGDCAGVTFLAGEGSGGLSTRLKAYAQENPSVEWGMLRVIKGPLDLMNPAGALAVVDRMQADALQYGPSSIVVIDTMNATMPGGEENSSVSMSQYLANMRLIAEGADCFVLVVHHTGKDATRGPRGHSSFRAALDAAITVQEEVINKTRDNPAGEKTGARELWLSKPRDAAANFYRRFILRAVTLGQDSDGDAITSCVIEKAPEPAWTDKSE